MKKRRLVSIIVPVYNTEPTYLNKCIRSIIDQSYKTIEIIVVNDGSTNIDTINTLNRISKYKQIRLVNTENGGVSAARNKGIELANGEYVVFIDSDDYISNKYVEGMIIAISAYSAVFSGKQKVQGKTISSIDYRCNKKFLSLPADGNIILSHSYAFTSQGAMFKMDEISNVRFRTNLSHGEDTLFVAEALRGRGFVYTGEGGYYYVDRDSSASNQNDVLSTRGYIEGHAVMLDALATMLGVRKEVANAAKIEKVLNASRKLITSRTQFATYKKEIGNYLTKMNVERMDLGLKGYYSFAYKIRLWLLSGRHFAISYLLSKLKDK